MKRTTFSSIMQGMCYSFTALLFAASCANDNVTQDEKQNKDNIPAGATLFTGESHPEATVRTAILNHTKGAGASVNWSSTDKIWVKDDGGNWQQSTTTIIPFAANPSYAQFALSGTYTGASHDILYTNTAVTGTQPKVVIEQRQTQSAPNNFDHAGVSGDCGIATGSKSGSGYTFNLNHKASYLCFIPRTNNEYVKRSKLIKVEITSDDYIAGTYDIAADGSLTLASFGSKTITVTTGSGFDIDNTADDMSKNATYAVVAPGTHTFRIRYWLRNTSDNPKGPIEGTVSKIVTLNCTAGSIHDITANLNPRDYDGDHYCMWDAQEQFWKGYEWTKKLPAGVGQPTLNYNPPIATASSNYPKNNADPRWYHEGGGAFQATQSCATLPNANELSWYIVYGNPHWDTDELWTTMGHLYQGGMWFKKKSVLQAEHHYDTEKSADGSTDLRTTWKYYYNNDIPNSGLSFVADPGNYFYLPALGAYYRLNTGRLDEVENYGYYWSSSAYPWDGYDAYSMGFDNRFIGEGHGHRPIGIRGDWPE